ncbi:hypothetical protein HOD38_03615 [archaeon]|jgi:hypothetical protein|nr:hypothetical protein [archaeon]MBT4397328.1 hypothetical protein [archaeon]MBT4440708.1 hypothetical protein [archaeon]
MSVLLVKGDKKMTRSYVLLGARLEIKDAAEREFVPDAHANRLDEGADVIEEAGLEAWILEGQRGLFVGKCLTNANPLFQFGVGLEDFSMADLQTQYAEVASGLTQIGIEAEPALMHYREMPKQFLR